MFLRIRTHRGSFYIHYVHGLATGLHKLHPMAELCMIKCARCRRKQLRLFPVSLLMEARAGLAAVVQNCCEHRMVYACRG
jgi:hypothetical protein